MLSGVSLQLAGFAGEIKSKDQRVLQQVLIQTLDWSRHLSSRLLLATHLQNGIITWGFALQVS